LAGHARLQDSQFDYAAALQQIRGPLKPEMLRPHDIESEFPMNDAERQHIASLRRRNGTESP